MATIERKYININEVSKLTGISVSTLYKLTAAGAIPHFKPSGKLLFKEADIIAWVETSRDSTHDAINTLGQNSVFNH